METDSGKIQLNIRNNKEFCEFFLLDYIGMMGDVLVKYVLLIIIHTC